MRFGIFSNNQRHMTDVQASWREDIAEIKLADALKFEVAWLSEHTGQSFKHDGIACPDHLICQLVGETGLIRFGPAVRRIALHHPVQVAVELINTDHFARGRYFWAFGVGGATSGYRQRGIKMSDAHEMMIECLDVALRCISETTPFSFSGKFYRGEDVDVWPKPFQHPTPPIWFATATPNLIELGAGRGYNFLLSQYHRPQDVNRLGGLYSAARVKSGRLASLAGIAVPRAIYVSESDERAVAEFAPGFREHLSFNMKFFPQVTRLIKEWVPQSDDKDITFERLLEAGLMFVGSAKSVAARIREFHETSGGFGTLLYVTGKNWGTWDQRQDSMSRFMEQVAPKVADLNDATLCL